MKRARRVTKKCDTNSPGSVTVHLSSFSAELAPKCDSRHMKAGRRVVKCVKLFTLKENKVLVKQKALEKVKESCLSALSCSIQTRFFGVYACVRRTRVGLSGGYLTPVITVRPALLTTAAAASCFLVLSLWVAAKPTNSFPQKQQVEMLSSFICRGLSCDLRLWLWSVTLT